jgi:hypothetical protein
MNFLTSAAEKAKSDDQLAESFFRHFHQALGIPPATKIHLFILLISQIIRSWPNPLGRIAGGSLLRQAAHVEKETKKVEKETLLIFFSRMHWRK